MSGIASNPVAPPRYMRQNAPRPRSEAKRSRIIDAAMQHFAENGYNAARVGDIAAVLGIAKGSIFQHFGSKDGLFFEVYKRAKGQLEKPTQTPFNPSIATEPAEQELIRTLDALHKHWKNTLKDKNYAEAFAQLAKLQMPLAKLFDTVKILADDPGLRENRIALLQRVFAPFQDLLDFSKIQ